MRNIFLAGLAVAVTSVAPASAQTANLVAGETRQVIASVAPLGSCYVGRGPSSFQRNGTGPKAFITFDELWYAGQFDMSGQADLVFTTTTSGKIYFKNLAGLVTTISQPNFSNYSQSYNAATQRLSVDFTIGFPGCNLHVVAVYDGA